MPEETCDECGFDSREWTVPDAASFFGALGLWWRLATEGIEEELLNRRPAAATWSVLEYGLHSAFVTALHWQGIAYIHDRDGVDLGGPHGLPGDGPPLTLNRESTVIDLDREGARLAALARKREGWEHRGTISGTTITAAEALLHAVHDASHHMLDVSRILATTTAELTGTVHQINISGGGVPKSPIDNATVNRRGLETDRHADRRHHGRPFQALSLWSVEVIEELAGQGHPIASGLGGENITIRGIDWTSMRPGLTMRIDGVVAEVTFPATPCAKQTNWFSDGDFKRIDHDRNPQWTRWYAWVREPGTIARGGRITTGPNAR